MNTLEYLKALQHGVTEVRILRKSPYLKGNGGRGTFVGRTVSGYYDTEHYEKLISDIQKYEQDPDTTGIYTTLHRCDPALLGRAANRLVDAIDATSDNNITHFGVFPIDIDSGQASGVSATDSELEASKELAAEVAAVLSDLGLPVAKACSGNGWHILIFLEPLEGEF